jgi:hypothetical protein
MWLFVHMLSGPRILGIKNPLPWAWAEEVTIVPESEKQ